MSFVKQLCAELHRDTKQCTTAAQLITMLRKYEKLPKNKKRHLKIISVKSNLFQDHTFYAFRCMWWERALRYDREVTICLEPHNVVDLRGVLELAGLGFIRGHAYIFLHKGIGESWNEW